MKDEITFKIDWGAIDSDKLLDSLTAFTKLFHALYAKDKRTNSAIREGSSILAISPADFDEESLKQFRKAGNKTNEEFRNYENGKFNKNTKIHPHMRKLSESTRDYPVYVNDNRIHFDKIYTNITKTDGIYLDIGLERKRAFSHVRGKIGQVGDAKKNKLDKIILTTKQDEKISCSINFDLLETVKLYFGKEVFVGGMLFYNEDGVHIDKIEVAEIVSADVKMFEVSGE